MRRLSVVLGMVALAAAPSRAAAQGEMGVYVGTFWPLGGGWRYDVGSGGQVERRHIASHMLGARVAYWPKARMAVEGTLSFTPSQVAVSDPARIRDVRARVVLSSVRGLYRLASIRDGQPGAGFAHWDINAGFGIGLMSRSGSAWSNVSGTTHPGTIFGIEARNPVAGSFTVRVAVEDFVSWATFDKGLQSQTRWRVQNDIMFTFAAQVQLGKPRGAR